MNPDEQSLPYSPEAERSVLGALLLDGTAFDEASAMLGPRDFYLDSHQRIYRAIKTVIDAGHTADIVTIGEHLRGRKEIEAVGGWAYLATLTEGLPRRPSILEYCKIVKDKARLRNLIGIAEDAKTRAFDQSEDAETVLVDTQAKLESAVSDAIPTILEPLFLWAAREFPTAQEFYDRHKTNPGLPWGFRELDAITGGMHPAELIIVAARPGMGKTAFALNVADKVAVAQRKVVAFFSIEMGKKDLLDRLAVSRARVSLQKHRFGFLSTLEKRYMEEALADFNEKMLMVDDNSTQTVPQIRAKCRKLQRESGLDLVAVDYLQLMEGEALRSDNREREVARISRGLKAMAKELKVPVMVLTALSRKVEERRGSKRPLLSDLRESGAIEQDADVVIFIHRDAYYGEVDEDANRAATEFIVAKQRQGPTGTANAEYLESCVCFYDPVTTSTQGSLL